MADAPFSCLPVTPERNDDLVELFGPNGAYSNCWCTWWILRSREFDEHTPEERRGILERLVSEGSEPGLLAYDGARPERGRGVASALLDAAVGFAFDRDAAFVVGHPVDTDVSDPGAAALYVGTLTMFLDAGFTEVERRGTRPVVRLEPPRPT